MSSDLFQLLSLASSDGKVVGRLSDMETEEVSVVDRAANKRKFLLIKRDGGVEDNNMAKTTSIETETQHGATHGRLDEALDRIDALKLAVESAPSADEDTGVPDAIGAEARAVQCLLKGLAGVTAKSAFMVPVTRDLSGVGPIAGPTKNQILKVLDEVARRLETSKIDLGNSDVLDPRQAREIDATADLMAQVRSSKGIVVIKSALSSSEQDVLLSAIEKAMGGLCEVYVDLQTDAIAKGADHVADQFEVASMLHDYTGSVEQAIAEILVGKQSETSDPIHRAIESLRALAKVQGDDEAAMASRRELVESLKPVLAMAKGEESEGETDVEKVGRPMKGDRLNRLKGAIKLLKEALGDLRSGSVSLEKFKQVTSVLGAILDEVQTAKMVEASRGLNRDTETRGVTPDAPNAGAGVQPDTSAVATVEAVVGDGTPDELKEILKRIDKMQKDQETELKKRDEEISALKSQLNKRKRRSAPSAPPNDGETVQTAKGKGDDNGNVYWPRDMASWKPEN